MSTKLPPMPTGTPPGSAFWNDWYEKLRLLINNGLVSTVWSAINFTGSNITDIATRNHNNLQTIQGGTANEYYHFTNAEHTSILANSGILVLNSMAGDPTTSNIASGYAKLYKNTTSGLVNLWVNDSGTLRSVQLV